MLKENLIKVRQKANELYFKKILQENNDFVSCTDDVNDYRPE